MNTIITPVDGNTTIETIVANAAAASAPTTSDSNCSAPADCACNAPAVTDSTAAGPTSSPTSSPT
ncbi:MAG: hypothetical protein WC028_30060, partial [Candidatus Obscuribacterales bacterium]